MKYLIQVLMLTVVLFALAPAPAPVDLQGPGGVMAQVALSAPVPFPEIWWAPYETCVRK